ncbi:MAG TPA: class I SAM-dependent methyltransferase [Stellaceae bacterium]|nr:class I SAM-dependent methyltransferase [Stellaceae bacterium]
MPNFNIYHVKVNEFYRLYDDLILALSESLRDLGHSCTVKQNGFAADSINIILGSTIFASRYHSLATILQNRRYIVYQLECLDDRRGLLSEWPEYWEILQNAKVIWDYSPASTAYLKDKGIQNVYLVPPGFHRSLESFRPRQEPDIDVLFFGSPHERRQRIIDAIETLGFGVVNLQAKFGEARNRYIARSKIVLNIHAWDGLTPLETVRLSLLLANRAFVISEDSDHNPYDDGVVYGPYEELVDLCLKYLRGPASVREQVAAQGYLAVRKLDLVGILRTTLDAMGPAALPSLVSGAGAGTDSYYSQSRHDILDVVPLHSTRLLDIGCAGGLVGASLKQRQACHVTGIEIFADAALQAARLLDLAICGDAFAVLPSLADGAYDCVLMLDVLEHVADTAGMLRLAAAKLSDDGVLVLCVPNVAHWSVVQGLLAGRWDYADQGILDRTHLRFFTLGSLHRAVEEAGLQVIDRRSTQLANAAPPAAIVEAFRRHATAGRNPEVDMQSYQFVLTCRKI